MVYHDHSVLAKTARPHPRRVLTYSDVQKLSPPGIWLSFTYLKIPYRYHKHPPKTAIQEINIVAAVNTAKQHVCTATHSDHEPKTPFSLTLVTQLGFPQAIKLAMIRAQSLKE